MNGVMSLRHLGIFEHHMESGTCIPSIFFNGKLINIFKSKILMWQPVAHVHCSEAPPLS